MPYKTRERRLQYYRDYAKKNRARMTKYSRDWRRAHRETEKARLAKWRKDNPDKHYKINREGGWKHRGVIFTVEQWQELYKKQDGRCASCGSLSYKRLVLDHDHATGQVRGLLCDLCNRFVVMIVERHFGLINKAINYLEKYGIKRDYKITEQGSVGVSCFKHDQDSSGQVG